MPGENGALLHTEHEPEASGLHRVHEIGESEMTVFEEVRADVERELRKFGWSDNDIFIPKVAAEELVRNAITHGILKIQSGSDDTIETFRTKVSQSIANGAAKGKLVEVWVVATPQFFEIRVRDEGPVFEIKKLGGARPMEELMQTSGNGLLMLQTSGDLRVESTDPQGDGKTVIFTIQRGA